jgi:hypothetical protein
MPDAIELLSTRSSFKAIELKAPGPSAAEIDKLLTNCSPRMVLLRRVQIIASRKFGNLILQDSM